ncbi:regulatory protein RecX-like protein [Marinobacter lipolyticus SM19]|uniref:Regulatory protein RecX n=1 Tax=Marinobacter lipolyticus SM19 TaxID=1318628 RepID=R8AWR1_9GAMM|nr:regulatory protein RecX [Marinobacter lipolyticus]EON90764.1 regulatory protein RecX-like protein [Marinobacter lipolyticus SM19]
MAKQENPDDQEYKARSVALRLLARREHSRAELSLKLRQRKIENGVIERVLDDYEAEGWLDDDRFADVYARQRMDLGYGPLRIQAELQQRGVHRTPDCVDERDDNDWSEMAIRLRVKRFGGTNIHDDWEEKARQARFLTRRGFAADHIDAALDFVDPEDGLF